MAMLPVRFRLSFGLVLWLVCMNFAAASVAPVQPPNYNGPANSPKRAPVSPPHSPGHSGVSPPPRSPPSPPPPPSASPPMVWVPPPPPPGNMKWTGPARGLNGGEKAGIVIGTLTGAGVLACCGLVCKKRRSNMRRERLGYDARRPIL